MDKSRRLLVEDIFNKLNEERKTGELLPLDIDIYVAPSGEGGSEENSERAEQNLKKLITALKERRMQKILTYIAYGRSLPHQVPTEEERIYIRIKEIIKEEGSGTTTIRLRILEDTPEVITSEGKRLGPFRKNTTAEMSNPSDVEFMIKNKIGEPTKT